MAGVGNKAKLPADAEFFEKVAGEFGVPLAAIVPYDGEVPAADRRGSELKPEAVDEIRQAVSAIVDFVESPDAERIALLAERDRIEQRLAQLKGGS
jgi:CO dehydrogenase nickel-insertion accessory protein CooC1